MAEDFIGRPAPHFLDAAIDHQIAAVQILHQHAEWRMLHEAAEARLALAQRPFGLVPLRDVLDRAGLADDISRFVQHRIYLLMDDANRAVRKDDRAEERR